MNKSNLNLNETQKLLKLSTIIFIVLFMLPISKYINREVRLGITFIAYLLFLLSLLTSKRKIIISTVGFLVLVMTFSILNYLGQWTNLINMADKVYAYLLFWTPLLIGLLFLENSDKPMKIKIFNVITTLFIIISITTLVGLIIYPSASRDLASSVNTKEIYYLMNIGGYDFVYSLSIFVFVFNYKSKINIKVKRLIISLFILVVILSQYSTALIILVIGYIIMSLINKRTEVKVLVALGILFLPILMIIIPKNVYVLIADIINSLGLNTIGQKVLDFSISISQFDFVGTLYARFETLIVSANSFIKHPLFGNIFGNGGNVGGHSEFLDVLASTGLIGFIILTYTLTKYFNKVDSKMTVKDYRYFKIIKYLALILSIFNPIF